MRGLPCRSALCLLAPVTVASCAVSSSAAAAPAAKCRVVHHKKVCAKPKPKPKAKPVPAPALAAKIAVGGQIFDIADGFGSLWARVGSDLTNGGDTHRSRDERGDRPHPGAERLRHRGRQDCGLDDELH